MKLNFLVTLIVTVFCSFAFGQTETLITKNRYQGTFTVGGDKDTYYPVTFKSSYGNNQDLVNHLQIYRGYYEAGPDALSPTHKGALTLEINVNYGGWGGSSYDWKITDLRQTYHETFANATHTMMNMGFTVWLRGGGFIYHYISDYPGSVQVCLSSSELIYKNDNLPQYNTYSPAPLTAINWTNIQNHSQMYGSRSLGDLSCGENNSSTTGYGSKLSFLGASENTDPLWFSRYNVSTNVSSLRLNIGDDYNSNEPCDNFDIGSTYYADNKWYSFMTINSKGNVGIGTTNLTQKLSVNGTIRCKEVLVEATPWPDYVFAKGYKLRTLGELEAFIKANNHLPEMPAAADAEQNGVKLSELNTKLLQKVEELTLYLIEQNKKNEELKAENDKLKARDEQLNKTLKEQNMKIDEINKKINILNNTITK